MLDVFDLLDLERPGLEAVKAAVTSGNCNRAKGLLVEYYRTRGQPGWCSDKLEQRLFVFQDDATADEILARKFTILLKTAQLEGKIAWATNPFGDREWTWVLNRHYFFQTLAQEYQRTGDEEYAADFNEIVADWVISNPVPAECANDSAAWRTIEAGIRMLSSWPMAWHFFRNSPSFTVDARILMLKSFADHADYLLKFPTACNWTLMENNGLLHVGALFPEFRDAPEWREAAIGRLSEGMAAQVYPDGAQFELTASYHTLSLWNFLQPIVLKRIAPGFDFPAEYYDGLRRMMQFNAGIMRPDANWPMINDSDLGSASYWIVEPAISLGADKAPETKALLEIERERDSVFFPYAGISCMRTGDGPQDLYLMMDAGPFGERHQHEDKLNIEVCAYGRALVVDPGRYSYHVGAPFHGAGGHNLILVDGMGQNRAATDPSRWVVKAPAPGNRWVSSAEFDYAEGAYDEGFGPQNDASVAHIRKVFFVKPEYWIVIDLLRGDGEHKFEQLWHFVPGKVAAGRGFARTDVPDAANLAVVRSDDAEVRIVEAEETPVLGFVSYQYNEREPAPTAVFTRTCVAPIAFETVLYPSPAGKTVVPEVRPLRCTIDETEPRPGQISAISIRLPECEDIFVICHEQEMVGRVKRFLGFEFTGDAIWMRTDLKGGVVRTLRVGC